MSTWVFSSWTRTLLPSGTPSPRNTRYRPLSFLAFSFLQGQSFPEPDDKQKFPESDPNAKKQSHLQFKKVRKKRRGVHRVWPNAIFLSQGIIEEFRSCSL
ncbi:hypothetical protein AVEN_209214-1 [Araneus ventricosus]|uniref:Uncharacterized protein n=1 Tax=Araneus ventricosus TaxID=182803 RepID=A0A4Y2KUV7_ARAVE|nr:hypothetical protein AVEN_99826-1 [Araneus ventricosus]GBN06093.1 hypothetical protein AVEN_28527-1 [Araneus ventricosus]GBN06121.1 hypothetical protein AVEN_127255-1 [Araneus ventricosus]GBN06146.1 hypothetical protein AVEN_209214-1 [Araneus ventricosus]